MKLNKCVISEYKGEFLAVGSQSEYLVEDDNFSVENENEKSIKKEDLKDIVNSEVISPFLFNISKYSTITKILEKLECNNDRLSVFIILKQLKEFDKKDKEKIFKHLEETNQDENILTMIQSSKDFYKKGSKGILPIEFLNYLIECE